MKTRTEVQQKNTGKQYQLLDDTVLQGIYRDATHDATVSKAIKASLAELDGFIKKVEDALETELASEDRTVILSGFDEQVNSVVGELSAQYRIVAEAAAHRDICAMIDPALVGPAQDLLERRAGHLPPESSKSTIKFRMDCTDMILDLCDTIKTYSPDGHPSKDRYKENQKIYLAFRYEGIERMHGLCEDLQKASGESLQKAKLADQSLFELEAAKLGIDGYVRLESLLDYYDRKLQGKYTGDMQWTSKDRPLLKRIDGLVHETTLFSVMIGYTIAKRVKPNLDPHEVERAGIDSGELSSVMSSYGDDQAPEMPV